MSSAHRMVKTPSSFADQIASASRAFGGIIDPTTMVFRRAAATNMVTIIKLGTDEEAMAAHAVMEAASTQEYLGEDGQTHRGVIPSEQYKDWQRIYTERFVDPIQRACETLRADSASYTDKASYNKCAAKAGFTLLEIAEGEDEEKAARAVEALEALATERKLPRFIFIKFGEMKRGNVDPVEFAIQTFNRPDDEASDAQKTAAGYALLEGLKSTDPETAQVAAATLRQLASERRLPGSVYHKYTEAQKADPNNQINWAMGVLTKEIESNAKAWDAACFVISNRYKEGLATDEQVELLFELAGSKSLPGAVFAAIRPALGIARVEAAKRLFNSGVASIAAPQLKRNQAAFSLLDAFDGSDNEKERAILMDILNKALAAKLWNHPDAYVRFQEAYAPFAEAKREKAKAQTAKRLESQKARADAQKESLRLRTGGKAPKDTNGSKKQRGGKK